MDPMTDAELKAFLPYTREEYINDRVTNGGEDRRTAEEVAATSMAECFPDDRPAEGHWLFTGRDASTDEQIGVLWLFERNGVAGTAEAAGTSVFIYGVEVDSGRRGHGWGRELMTYAERWAAARGAREIALNVFGGNTVARGLYTSLGYSERAVAMAKALGPMETVQP